MSCWVCGNDTCYVDDYNLDWCNDHLVIWKEAWEATDLDNSL